MPYIGSMAKLINKVRSVANESLMQYGLDGNGRFDKPSLGLSVALDLLAKHGIEIADVVDSFRFTMPEGRITVDLAWTSAADSFSPVEIDNSMLVLAWYKCATGRYECVAYLS